MYPNKDFIKNKKYGKNYKNIELNSRKMNTPEYVSEDILEEDFVKCFRLVFYIQMALASCRVHNEHRFVTSPTIYQRMYSILLIMVTVILYAIIIQSYSSRYKDSVTIYYFVAGSHMIDLAVYICNIIQVRFLNGDDNMFFFIKLQTLDRLMKIEHNATIITMLRTINMITMIFFITIYVAFFVSLIYEQNIVFICSIGVLNSQITFMMEIANCSNFIVYFFIRVRFLNSIICNHLYPEKNKQIPKHIYRIIPAKCWMRYMAAQSHDLESCDTQIYLKEIFDGFQKLQHVYKFQVFIFCIKMVAETLIIFEFILFGVQSNVAELSEIIVVIIYAIIHCITTVILGLRFELFFREVKETKRLSIGVLLRYQEGPLREKAKRMLKMIEESSPCFSVYDMWQMDAHTSLNIFSLITSLIVTLLQFAYL